MGKFLPSRDAQNVCAVTKEGTVLKGGRNSAVHTDFRSRQNSERRRMSEHYLSPTVNAAVFLLDNICKEKSHSSESVTPERRSSIREPPTRSTMYKRVCIFCDKVSKYVKGNDVREKLIQCIDLRADENIRKTALARKGSKMLAFVSLDLVAAEACYHGTCYREYTRPKRETSTTSTSSLIPSDEEYAHIESAAYEKLSIISGTTCWRSLD